MTLPQFPATESTLLLPGPAGALEVAVDLPDPGTVAQPVIALVCHPLPTEGGSMDNKVVTMAARALREVGVTTVRFNFRGVGHSQGGFDQGAGETQDLRAVAAWVRAQRPQQALWLVGFSFGAAVSIAASNQLQAAVLISIAPPAERWSLPAADTPQMPWLVIQGEADEIVDPASVYAWLEQLAPPHLNLVKVAETSHFFHGKLIELRQAVREGVAPWLTHA